MRAQERPDARVPPAPRPRPAEENRLLRLQETAGNTVVSRLLAMQRQPMLTTVPVAHIEGATGPVLVFDRAVTPEEATAYLWGGPISNPSALTPDPPVSTPGDRHLRFRLRLGSDLGLIGRMPVSIRDAYLAVITRAAADRAPLPGLRAKLDAVGKAGATETGGTVWQAALRDFRTELDKRVASLPPDAPLPPDVSIVVQALILWSTDPGNQWGEGWYDSSDLVMSAAEYATVPASQYKCNAYVAETLYKSLGLVHKAIQQQGTGKYFPYQAKAWGDTSQAIPHFVVTTGPVLGDIWSNGHHTGIFLGTYQGKNLYISARDDGSGVFALEKGQLEHGIQIKYMDGGVFRHYTP